MRKGRFLANSIYRLNVEKAALDVKLLLWMHMNKKILKTFRLIALATIALTFHERAISQQKNIAEQLNLGEGLSINHPQHTDISYQAIPSFNASKKMLQRHNEGKLQYFISIDRLGRGSTSSQSYFERLLRDIGEASTENSLKIIDQGEYWTLANVRGAYVDFVFTPAGSNRQQHHIAHFLTNSYRNYVAIAVLVDQAAEQQMHEDTLAWFGSASISTLNAPVQPASQANMAQ